MRRQIRRTEMLRKGRKDSARFYQSTSGLQVVMSKRAVRELSDEDLVGLDRYWSTCSDEVLLIMGVDKEKLQQIDLIKFVRENLFLPYELKQTYFIVWTVEDLPIGHSNVGKITFGEEALMHLHIWDSENRQRGIGKEMVLKSLRLYFDALQLKRVYCEPHAINDAPNKTLAKVGFIFVKVYEPVPGLINFPQTVNQWVMTRENYEQIVSSVEES